MFQANRIKDQIVAWIAMYFKENAGPETKAVIGISGGKDSSVVAALCVEALGTERVLGVLMPQGTQEDIAVAYDLCQTLNIPFVEINIAEAVEAIYEQFRQAGVALTPVTTSNTPARVRMTTLYGISGSIGGRVANTCNYSEDWVGYSTKFGDAAGDFSPLADLTVTEVKAVGEAVGLPARFTEKIPIDGLCGKSDEDNLGFSYETLDLYIRQGILPEPEVKAKIDRLHALNLHKLQPMPQYTMIDCDE